MDNIGGGGDGIGNEFEFNFANAGFSRFDDDDDNMHNNTHHTGGGGGYQTKSTIGGNNNLNNARDINKSLHSNNTTTTTAYFPDYTGSREVGIDVGTPPPPSAHQSKPSLIPPELPPLPAVPKYPLVAKSSSGDTLNNNLVSENIKLSQLSQQMPSKMAPNAPKLTNKDSSEEEEEEEDDDLNFSYFDAYKKGGVIQDEKKDKKTAPSTADQIAMQKSSEKEFKPMNIGNDNRKLPYIIYSTNSFCN